MLVAGALLLSALLFSQDAAKPPKPLSPESRGDVFMAHKMYREAVGAYREGPQDSAVILNKIGIAYHQLLELGSAMRYYNRAINLNPKYAEAINNLGTVYYARKGYRQAIRYYRRALEIAPNSASIYSNLGTAYFARRQYDLAFATYQKALSLDPEIFEHRGAQGVLLQERTVGERSRFHYYLAKTYAKAGVPERALLYMRKAIEEGFKERNRFLEEPEFASLRDLPEFKEIMAIQAHVP
jgi:tetratricopeptide (TPR) repeat protein